LTNTSVPATAVLPEQGQVVLLRHKVWLVKGVFRTGHAGATVHRVSVECLSDDGLGRTLDVIWEREVAATVFEASTLPIIRGLDSPSRFQAFLDAVRWSSSSLAEGAAIQAPFRGGVEIEDYQLVPVTRAASMPRVNLLIADDVGLGKTIEAGLIAQELIHTHRASKILVVCPAHLKSKWLDEMRDKFGLEFRAIDRENATRMRREFGPTINPWASFPRLVTSIDYLKAEQPRRLFEELFDKSLRDRGLRPWDLLILDEAHNAAPAGRKHYVRDSDRTTLLRAIAGHFEHKLFLTATPHNGYRESFTGLLELLDDLRFSRGLELDRKQLEAVTIRRLKEDIRLADGRPRFPPRVILPKSPEQHPDLYVNQAPDEQELFALLKQYTDSRLQGLDKRSERPTHFVLTLLKKRALSSPLALRESLVTHTESVGVREELGVGESLFRSLEERDDDWGDDDEKEQHIELTTEAASRLWTVLSVDEKQWLQRMFEIADGLRKQPDSKAAALLRWIERHLRAGGAWGRERLIVFTEYRHTLEYLREVLQEAGYGDAVLTIVGGMRDADRISVNEAFQTHPDQHPVRILLATDAASEGADFQNYCRNLIHYEIPWNPVRLEQRNGRIDRHGQTADEVRIHHFVLRNNDDSEFLARIVEKVEAIRTDLGSVGPLIAESVRLHALGSRVDIEAVDKDARREIARTELQLGAAHDDEVKRVTRSLQEARMRLGITSDRQENLLREALALEQNATALQPARGDNFQLTQVPSTWSECRRFVSSETHERNLTFERARSGSVEPGGVLHLDHPLMRRSIATLRAQMWRSVGQANGDDALFRVSAGGSPQITRPLFLVWARLVLMGPERNILHDGLFVVAAEASHETLVEADAHIATQIGDIATELPYSGTTEDVKRLILPIQGKLEELVEREGAAQAASLAELLAIRGSTSEKQARGLATERMAEIRRTIRQWEKEAADAQLTLFDEEERGQREHDLDALRARLLDLEATRETEPKRQRQLFKVADWRAHPIAVRAVFPAIAS
jgi:superfamily II DNA/RNA helicase